MRKRFFLPIAAVATVILLGAVGVVAGPAGRTRGYFAFKRQWTAHWPLPRGRRLLPVMLEPVFQPFVPIRVQVERGVNLLLDPQDWVSRVILDTGVWEPDNWAAIRQHLASGGTFVDVGAHIGYYSLKAAEVVGPAGHVIAIDPNPEIIRQLRDNISASEARTISVQPVACADAEGTLELFAARGVNTGQTSLSHANASQSGQAVTTYRVRARPLDDILREERVSRVDVVKIDVEGAEFLVLKGAQDMLDRYHPVLLVELIESQLQAMGTSSAEVRALLSAHGYVARGVFGDVNVEFARE